MRKNLVPVKGAHEPSSTTTEVTLYTGTEAAPESLAPSNEAPGVAGASSDNQTLLPAVKSTFTLFPRLISGAIDRIRCVLDILVHHTRHTGASSVLDNNIHEDGQRYTMDASLEFTEQEWLAGGFDWHNEDETLGLSIHGCPSRLGPSGFSAYPLSPNQSQDAGVGWGSRGYVGQVYNHKGDVRVRTVTNVNNSPPNVGDQDLSIFLSRDIFHCGVVHAVAPKPVYGTAVTRSPSGVQWLIAICGDSVNLLGEPWSGYPAYYTLTFGDESSLLWLSRVPKHEVYARLFDGSDDDWVLIGERQWSDTVTASYRAWNGTGLTEDTVASARFAYRNDPDAFSFPHGSLISRQQENWFFKQDGTEAVARVAENLSGYVGDWDGAGVGGSLERTEEFPLVECRVHCRITFSGGAPVATFDAPIRAWSVDSSHTDTRYRELSQPMYYGYNNAAGVDVYHYPTPDDVSPLAGETPYGLYSHLDTGSTIHQQMDFIDAFDWDAQGRLLAHKRTQVIDSVYRNQVVPSNVRREYVDDLFVADVQHFVDLADLSILRDIEIVETQRAFIEVVDTGEVVSELTGGSTWTETWTHLVGPRLRRVYADGWDYPVDETWTHTQTNEGQMTPVRKPTSVDLRHGVVTYREVDMTKWNHYFFMPSDALYYGVDADPAYPEDDAWTDQYNIPRGYSFVVKDGVAKYVIRRGGNPDGAYGYAQNEVLVDLPGSQSFSRTWTGPSAALTWDFWGVTWPLENLPFGWLRLFVSSPDTVAMPWFPGELDLSWGYGFPWGKNTACMPTHVWAYRGSSVDNPVLVRFPEPARAYPYAERETEVYETLNVRGPLTDGLTGILDHRWWCHEKGVGVGYTSLNDVYTPSQSVDNNQQALLNGEQWEVISSGEDVLVLSYRLGEDLRYPVPQPWLTYGLPIVKKMVASIDGGPMIPVDGPIGADHSVVRKGQA